MKTTLPDFDIKDYGGLRFLRAMFYIGAFFTASKAMGRPGGHFFAVVWIGSLILLICLLEWAPSKFFPVAICIFAGSALVHILDLPNATAFFLSGRDLIVVWILVDVRRDIRASAVPPPPAAPAQEATT